MLSAVIVDTHAIEGDISMRSEALPNYHPQPWIHQPSLQSLSISKLERPHVTDQQSQSIMRFSLIAVPVIASLVAAQNP